MLDESNACPSDRVCVDLGCGKKKPLGFIGVDKVALPGVDIVADISVTGIPFEDDSIDLLRAHDFIEHVTDKIGLMNDAYRSLKPDGIFDIRVPSTDGRGAFQDPTHVSYWNQNSFMYFTEGHYREVLEYYGIECRFIAEELYTTEKNALEVCIVVARLRAIK